MKEQLNELHLFAGAGGGILGGILCGHTTVCAVEIEPYCRKVLLQRQRDGILPKFPIWDDVQTFDGNPWRGKVDIICGGFPCQDISAAGKGAGIEGSRSSMWKHMARIIGEVRPKYAFVENSPMLVGRGLSTVLADLAEMGYDAKWGVVGAHHVSAPHRRDRIWILANSKGAGTWKNIRGIWERSCGADRRQESSPEEMADSNVRGCNDGSNSERQHQANHAQVGQTAEDQQSGSIGQHWTSKNGCDVSNPISERGCSRDSKWQDAEDARQLTTNSGDNTRKVEWWDSEPNVGRVANGVASRVNRLKAIGNGQVPAVAELAWKILTQ